MPQRVYTTTDLFNSIITQLNGLQSAMPQTTQPTFSALTSTICGDFMGLADVIACMVSPVGATWNQNGAEAEGQEGLESGGIYVWGGTSWS